MVNGGDGLSELLGDRDGLDLAANLDGDGVGDDALDDGGIVQALDGRTGEDAVGGRRKNILRHILFIFYMENTNEKNGFKGK